MHEHESVHVTLQLPVTFLPHLTHLAKNADAIDRRGAVLHRRVNRYQFI